MTIRFSISWPHLLSALVAAACLLLVNNGPMFWRHEFPGDLIDSRFNMYILEHVYRWLSGADTSLASPTIFYPFPGVYFFSDAHIGSALVYASFRALGQSQYMAYDEWFLIGYLSTFIAAYYAIARFGAEPFMAALGAAIFTFSLPSIAQFGHSQLVYRCGIPLALLYLWQSLKHASPRNFILMLIWLCVQLIMSIYLGIFLALMLLGFAIVAPLVEHTLPSPRDYLHAITEWVRSSPGVRRPSLGKSAAYLIICLLLLTITVSMIMNYAHVSREYGFQRDWREISTMLPRPASYLLMENLPYWAPISRMLAANIPMPHEQNLFVGFGALGFAAVGLFAILRNSDVVIGEAPARTMAVLLFLVVLITSTDGYTLYYRFASLPGLNAIRAVARIGLVLAFPVGMIASFGLQALVVESKPKVLGRAIAALFACLAGYEFATVSRYTTPIETSEQRVDAIVAAAVERARGIASPILLVVAQPGDDDFAVQLDAMLAAQRLGWPTVNGYSGNVPPGVAPSYSNCSLAARQFAQYDLWRQGHKARNHGGGAGSLITRVVFVGSDCDSDPLNRVIPPAPWRTEPTSENAPADVVIIPNAIGRKGSAVPFEVTIQNHNADNWIPGNSSFPVSLSWRFVTAAADSETANDGGWDPREAMTADIPPGGSLKMAAVATTPTKPGHYHLEVSMVADGLFFFHNKGMRPSEFNQIVTVP